MKIAIHQPNFMPWAGYFYKMANSDVFVILDNVQYEKNAFLNRTMIKTPQGLQWLTVPIKTAGLCRQKIFEAEIQKKEQWQKKYIKAIEMNYKKARYFNYLFPELKNILEKDWQFLSDLNIALIELLRTKLGIKNKLEFASKYNFSGESTDLLINVLKFFEASVYLSGMGGKQYQDESKIKLAGIEVEYSNYVCVEYPQLWGKFIPNLSIIDLLFNCGPESLKIILQNKKI